MKCVQPSAHPGHTDLRRGEGFVERLREQVFEVQFLYFGVSCFLQSGQVTALLQSSSSNSGLEFFPVFRMRGLPHAFSQRRWSKSIEILKFIYGEHPLCSVTISRFNTVDTTICHVLYSL